MLTNKQIVVCVNISIYLSRQIFMSLVLRSQSVAAEKWFLRRYCMQLVNIYCVMDSCTFVSGAYAALTQAG